MPHNIGVNTEENAMPYNKCANIKEKGKFLIGFQSFRKEVILQFFVDSDHPQHG